MYNKIGVLVKPKVCWFLSNFWRSVWIFLSDFVCSYHTDLKIEISTPTKKGNFPHTSTLCTRLLYFRLNHYSSFFQVGVGFNRDKWENLERYARSCTKIYKNVYVCTGPLYLPSKDFNDGKNYVKYQVIGKNNVAVPTHFFKVIVGELDNNDGQQLEMEAYVLPNAQIPDNVALATFQVIISSKLYMLSVFVLKTRLKIVSVLT